MNIGKQIKTYRKKAGLTQKELGEKINKSEVTIRKYESNQREPKMNVIKDICNALNVSVGEFGNELFHEYDIKVLAKEVRQIELIEELFVSFGYRIKHHHCAAATEEEAEAMANNPEVPIVDIINSNGEKVTLTILDWDLLTNNLKKFVEFELFKLMS